jgi:hypothetical protein
VKILPPSLSPERVKVDDFNAARSRLIPPLPWPTLAPTFSGGTRVKRALGVQAALEWAFRVEKAQLELPPPEDVSEEGFGFGLEYVRMQRAALGCKVDGGQHKMGSHTHADAEIIAAIVGGMPDSLGGIRMAIRVAELARAGLTPDWMPRAVPRCVPVETRRNQHGERAVTEVVGTEGVLHRVRDRQAESSFTAGCSS